MNNPLISICIPSYERTEYLERLLESIKVQTFKNFEVIFTDDSKTDRVQIFVQNYKAEFPIYYHRNTPSLGTAKNMLEGIKYAHSQWIKIIHDDDFFSTDKAMQLYSEAISPEKLYIFSGYFEYHEDTGKCIDKTISQKKFAHICLNPSLLFADNLLGPPSVLMLSKNIKEIFDINLKWFTDMEYYFRVINSETAVYIGQPLVNVSHNDTQVTNFTRTNASVIIPESLCVLNKHGKKAASNIIAYDSWWRAFRNMETNTTGDIQKYAGNILIPSFIKTMLKHQRFIPKKLIKIGIVSKCCMGISYFLNVFNKRAK